MQQKMDPMFLIIDLFCGFGGTTTGFADAEIDGQKIAKVIACINHDPNAIRSHWLNHKDVKHFEEDIRTLDVTGIVTITNYYRQLYPEAKVILWASLECTNFSKAKGGGPRNADSRTLAEHLYRYIAAIDPDYVQIENVVEFMSWGPLDENGKPVSRDKGKDWMKWRRHIKKFGYKDDWRQINSADLGAYTSRNRLFGCFAKKHLPIVWPELTHSKKPIGNMFGGLKKWNAVKEVLDFADEGKTIFREKPLSDKTLERIYAGLVKFVAKGDTSFISKYYSGKPSGKVISTEGPAGTITTADGQSLVQTEFLAAYYGNGDNVSSVESPCPVIPTKDRFQLIQPKPAQNQSVHEPAGTILPKDKHSLIDATPFIMPTNYSNEPKSIEEPCPTITASRKHHYILNPSHGGHSTATSAPCPVIVARQDKAPLYLVQCPKGKVKIEVYDTDTEPAIKIKQFMAAYDLVDVKMRMLRVSELLLIQGLNKIGREYQMTGSQTEQKKFIGNSVHPFVPKHWAEAMGNELLILKKAA